MTCTYRWPPLSSVRLCFHTLPNWTLISRPPIKSWLSGSCSFATLPGRSSPKIPPKSLDSHQIRYSSGILLCATHPFTFSHVVFKASRLYRSSSSIVCFFSLSFNTVPSKFFRPLASRRYVRSFRSARILSGSAESEHTRVNHVHDFRVHHLLHASLLFLELACPIPVLAHVKLAEVILRSCLAKQTVATRAHPPSQ